MYQNGYPLSPTIFNVLLDTVLRGRVTVLPAAEGTAAPDIEVLYSTFNGWQHIYMLATDYLHQLVNTDTSGIRRIGGYI